MKRLQNIDGCLAYFLGLALNNLNSKKNIRIDQLFVVAESVNNRYEAAIPFPFNVKDMVGVRKNCAFTSYQLEIKENNNKWPKWMGDDTSG